MNGRCKLSHRRCIICRVMRISVLANDVVPRRLNIRYRAVRPRRYGQLATLTYTVFPPRRECME
jgi:hypothetical protein